MVLITYVFKGQVPPSPIKVVEALTLTPKNIEKTVTLIGIVRAFESTQLLSKANGILQIDGKPGAFVPKGSRLAHVINDSLKKQFECAQTAQEIAHEQYERSLTLQSKGAAAKQGVDEKKSLWLVAQARFHEVKIECDKTEFVAPFDGVIGTYLVRSGTEVGVGTPIVSLYAPSEMLVEFDIPAPLVPQLPDQPKVAVDGKAYVLEHVQRMVDERTHMSPAQVTLQDSKAMIGTPVSVELCVTSKLGVHVVPDEAVFIQNGKSAVYVIRDAKAHLVLVELGIRSKDMVEITKGLKDGDVVVSKNPQRLMDGMGVKVLDPSIKKTETKTTEATATKATS